MRKRLSVIASVLALLLALTGCSAVSTIRKLDAAEDSVEAKLDVAEDKVEAGLDSVEKQLEDALGGTQAAAPKADITKEQAQQIALDHLGFTEDQVTGLKTEYEIDDGVPQFDVSFFQEDWEYEFEIDAREGTILSFDKDHRYD